MSFHQLIFRLGRDGCIVYIYFYLFEVLRRFQHCTGHITMGSWKGRGNQYIQLVKVLYCKLPTNGKQLPAFPLEAMPGTEPRPQSLQNWLGSVVISPLVMLGLQNIKHGSLGLVGHSSRLVLYCNRLVLPASLGSVQRHNLLTNHRL